MTIERISLLGNIGQFHTVNAGAQLPFSKIQLIYAENGRGKTTLATILRSLGTGVTSLVTERQRLGAQQTPHVIIASGSPAGIIQFQHGTWTGSLDTITVFDDAFVSANVCSGTEIDAEHRQNLHELILGAQGVGLNTTLRGHASRVEQHNQALRVKGDAVPGAARGTLTVEAFCALKSRPNVDKEIEEAQRNLSAAQAADAIRQRTAFLPLTLPMFDIEATTMLLRRTLPDLEAEAAARVRAHLRNLGKGGEGWVSEGMARITSVSEGQAGEVCPFCAQDLDTSPLIRHYQAYFSDAYSALRTAITDTGKGVTTAHGGEIPAAFERAVRVAIETRDFWSKFVQIPEVAVDTASFMRTWVAAREAMLTVLRAKAAAPLEAMRLPEDTAKAVENYHAQRQTLLELFGQLEALGPAIALIKEKAAGANVVTLTADLAKLTSVRQRYLAAIAPICDAYLAEKAAKKATEVLRDQARAALDQYRQQIFPIYQTAINTYLGHFNAGFRLHEVGSVNNRSGSSATYQVLINNVAVNPTADQGPSFRNTLSAGDRNTLALAFFFASIEHDPQIARKIVVIDDPMTSLDEHRSLTTVQQILGLATRVTQVIVLSHSKPFLCAVWEGAPKNARSAIRISRDGMGSTLETWDVKRDMITEHDRRSERVIEYIRAGNAAMERTVAADLRPMLEVFVRVAYPSAFPPGTLLGQFINTCRQRVGHVNQVLNATDITELKSVVDYANRFHHDTNAAWETAAINDQELSHYCTRVVSFARRP